MINPIFILGVPRSGTTLLRVLLDSHSKIAGAPETPWLLGGYGPTSLREIIVALTEHKTGPVINFAGVTKENVIGAALRFADEIFSTYLQAKNKEHLVLKTPDDIKYLDFLFKLYPASKYIHIIRDGRDVASSTVNSSGTYFGKMLGDYGQLNYENAARRWFDWESNFYNIVSGIKAPDVFDIKYEELINDPETQLKCLFDFIGIDFEESILDYATFNHEYPDWEAGSNDVKKKSGIDKSTIGRWRTQIPENDIIKINKLCKDLFMKFGYDFSGPFHGTETPLTAGNQPDHGIFSKLFNYIKRL